MSAQPSPMDVELVPTPDPADPAAAAARRAIARERLDRTSDPAALTGPWWAAGLAEATRSRIAGIGWEPGRAGQVPSVRSIRGATRA